MKTKILILTGLLLASVSSGQAPASGDAKVASGAVVVQCSPDLLPLVNQWAGLYNGSRQGSSINVQETEKNIMDLKVTNLTFVSSGYYHQMAQPAGWDMVVGREALVPVMNAANPMISELGQRGVSPQELAEVAGRSGALSLANGQSLPLHFYYINDDLHKSAVSRFLKTQQTMTAATAVADEEAFIKAVGADKYGIGFCSMSSVFDRSTQDITAGLCLLPVDKNGNGKIDYQEKIYDNWQSFLRGVWIGKYPRELCNNIYLMSSAKPTREGEVDFVKWVVTAGQDYLNANGYFDLVYSDRQRKLDMFSEAVPLAGAAGSKYPVLKLILAIAGVLAVIFIVSNLALSFRKRWIPVRVVSDATSGVIDVNTLSVPKGLYFDKGHTWTFMEKSGVVRIGIDDFLQHITGPLTRVKMKSQGEKVSKGEVFLSVIQDGKQLNLKSPVSGVITEVNSSLRQESTLINSSPYVDGWVYMIEPNNWLRDSQLLLMYENYRVWLKNEFSRLKDFLALNLKAHNQAYAPVVLQDGGLLNDNVLAGLGPEVWDDFQTKYLDTAR